MGNPAGEKRDFEALEKSRLKAVRLVQKKNIDQAEVARRVGVCRQTVSRWMKEFRAGGEKALQKAARAGRKPKLTNVDREILKCLLESGPEEHDLEVEASVWTCRSVADLIAQEFGITYHPGHVWRILNQLSWARHQQPKSRKAQVEKQGAAGHKRPKPSFQDLLDSYDKKLRQILEKMGRSDLVSR